MAKHYRSVKHKSRIDDMSLDPEEIILGADCEIYTDDGVKLGNTIITNREISSTNIKCKELQVDGNMTANNISANLVKTEMALAGAVTAETIASSGTGVFSQGITTAKGSQSYLNGNINLNGNIFIDGQLWDPWALVDSDDTTKPEPEEPETSTREGNCRVVPKYISATEQTFQIYFPEDKPVALNGSTRFSATIDFDPSELAASGVYASNYMAECEMRLNRDTGSYISLTYGSAFFDWNNGKISLAFLSEPGVSQTFKFCTLVYKRISDDDINTIVLDPEKVAKFTATNGIVSTVTATNIANIEPTYKDANHFNFKVYFPNKDNITLKGHSKLTITMPFRWGNIANGGDRFYEDSKPYMVTVFGGGQIAQTAGKGVTINGPNLTVVFENNNDSSYTSNFMVIQYSATGSARPVEANKVKSFTYTTYTECSIDGVSQIPDIVDKPTLNPDPGTNNPSVGGVKIVSWADGGDDEIIAMLEAHYAGKINIANYWKVGDTRITGTPRGEIHYLTIIGIKHDTLASGGGKAAITVMDVQSYTFRDSGCWHYFGEVSAGGISFNGNLSSYQKTSSGPHPDVNWSLWATQDAACPANFFPHIKTVIKRTVTNIYDRTAVNASVDCFLLSGVELYGNSNDQVSHYCLSMDEGTQYSYFQQSDCIYPDDWHLLRSAYKSDGKYIVKASGAGSFSYEDINGGGCVYLAFCL